MAAEIAAASGRRVSAPSPTSPKPDEVRRAVDASLAAFGHIDVLVNALGDSIRKPLVTLPGKEDAAVGLSDDELRFIIDVNLTEALLCTRAVGPHMLQRRSGKVINIASWTPHQGGRDMVLYTTAKTALAGFTRAQVLEWAPYGVHVNAIAPGIFSRCRDVGRRAHAAGHPARRADRATEAAREAAGGRLLGALPRVSRVGTTPVVPAYRSRRARRARDQ